MITFNVFLIKQNKRIYASITCIITFSNRYWKCRWKENGSKYDKELIIINSGIWHYSSYYRALIFLTMKN